jgi:YgiT-type zinc finger domain-containing protein
MGRNCGLLPRTFQALLNGQRILSKGSAKDGFSTFTADADGCIIVIKGVPSLVCAQCGEASYNNETARRLEQIVVSVMSSASAEIAVVCYSEKVA